MVVNRDWYVSVMVVFTRLRSDVLMSILRLSKWASFLLLYKPSWSTTSRPHRSYSKLLLSWKTGNALFKSLLNCLFYRGRKPMNRMQCCYFLQLGNFVFMKTRSFHQAIANRGLYVLESSVLVSMTEWGMNSWKHLSSVNLLNVI